MHKTSKKKNSSCTSKTPHVLKLVHMTTHTHILCGRTTFHTQLNYVHNYYGPYA